MNNYIENGIKRAFDDYTVSICIDESNSDVLSSLEVPVSVSIDTKHAAAGLYIVISGDAKKVIETEVALYDILNPPKCTYVNSVGYIAAE